MSTVRKQPVICLMGPTASGKTEVAMRLADAHRVGLISVDSALVYRGMNIGTAKPDSDLLRRYPHDLIDIRDPEDTYSAGDFVRDANRHIDALHAEGRVPLLVGGTMMYFRALVDGMADLPAADKSIRADIDAAAMRRGWPALHADLLAIDPLSANRIKPRDGQRIQRALEVYRISGRCLSDWQAETAPGRHHFTKLALLPEPRAELHARIAARLDTMLESGFIDEIKLLMERPDLTKDHASMRAVGYRQFWAHLAGDVSFDAARATALAATRQLAKRQLTWLRNETALQSLNPLETDAPVAISRHLQSLLNAQACG